jgi:site-specific recombinase XerD
LIFEEEPAVRYIVNDQLILMRPPQGTVAAYVRPFSEWVVDQGYQLDSLRKRIRIAADFSRWLGKQTVQLSDIRARHCSEYLRYRRRRRKILRGDVKALEQFQDYLCKQGVIRPEKISSDSLTAVKRCAREFERYLREQRLLAPSTIINYVPFVDEFLKDRFGTGLVDLSRLCARDVISFVQRRAPHLHVKRAKLLTTALRSFLRYGCYSGQLEASLVASVPIVANWSTPLIPRAILPDGVRQVLSHVDRRTGVGRRDYAILLLLARLGLRAGEIASLELEDIDWSSGSLSVRGKGDRRNQLPLPKEVGTAVVAYLRCGRSRSSCRRLFLCANAPVRGFLGASAVSTIVQRALERAGVQAPTRGAHQFRHGLASEMLRHGASLDEIGELLGHRSPETTKIYAKVDLEVLRTLALPWPGGAR